MLICEWGRKKTHECAKTSRELANATLALAVQ